MMQSNVINTHIQVQKPCTYICSECHFENELTPRQPIRCAQCGYRVLYKKRTNAVVQFDAR
ncbi:hypothetical protein BCR44DRAFT_45303 [Catenaria anguillulae PL171]|uniref:DNA directed RNA polymerase n=1 Tax=Catenaria anguillulae PL171 TaxID=765915 RepID=A0A1Y2HDG4_9FUNG|nr:hypothetical protein BCR44DRAFT_45303 [Catenaria anguillulae PL171]